MTATQEPDGTSEQSLKVILNPEELRAHERAEWEKKWGAIRKLDQAIQKVIDKEHCKKYCGLIAISYQDSLDCEKHHDELYRRYLDALGKKDLADVIAGEFRWENYL